MSYAKLSFLLILLFCISTPSYANPIISGISSNEINIDTEFKGAKILLFGAKGDAGHIVIAVRGPKKNFLITKKSRLLGIWHNGERLKFKDSYSFYSIFSNSADQNFSEQLFADLELGKSNLKFLAQKNIDIKKHDEFRLQLLNRLEQDNLYSADNNKIEFLDETLFKVMIDFPKNIARGIYTVEIYLISDAGLISFQSIPIYVNQVGLSAKILDFAYQESFLYGLLAVAIAISIGWLTNFLFTRFIRK